MQVSQNKEVPHVQGCMMLSALKKMESRQQRIYSVHSIAKQVPNSNIAMQTSESNKNVNLKSNDDGCSV